MKKPGEYIIRGQVHNQEKGEGLIESCIFPEANLVVASCLVDVGKSNIIPLRVWTLKEDVKIKKGQVVGEIQFTSKKSEHTCLREVSVTKERNRWDLLRPQFEEVNALPQEHKALLIPLLKEYCDIFSVCKNDIGLTTMVEHEIDTGSAKPIACQNRRIPFGLEEKVDNLIQELSDKNIIRPSESPWNAPLVIIPKKNGDLRLTVDFRKLNSITKRPIFPIPDANQLFDTLKGSVLFSTLDLSSGYYNIPMKAEDISKTAFSTRTNHWEFVRMPMGICSAPSTFQRLMHKIFEKEKWYECLIYLDDILVFAESVEDHIQRLRTIFCRIRESGVKLSPTKCKFMKPEVSYLGHTISSEGVKTDKKKTEKILEWPIPRSVEDLRSFVSFCGYYRKFIKDYASIVSPLELACKEKWNKKAGKKFTPLEWTDQLERSFQRLKIALTTAPVLSFPTPTEKFILDTDASHDAIGAVLSQVQNGKEKVIAYASKRLTQSQRQYCITRKELLAVYHFVTYFKHYLLGRKFIVRTDHRALCWMLSWKNPNTSQYCRWKEELEIYDMDVQFRSGKDHINADAMSRLPVCGQCELRHIDPKKKRNVKELNKQDEVHCRRMIKLESEINQGSDDDLQIIIKLLKSGRMSEKFPRELKYCSEECKFLWKKRQKLRFRGGLLHLVAEDNNYRLLIPKEKRTELIKKTHEDLAHIGSAKTSDLIKENYYWRNMDLDIRLEIAKCKSCARRKIMPQGHHVEEHLSTGFPFEKISIDLAGPLPPGENGESYILGIIDNFSRFAALIPLKRGTAEEVAKALVKHWISLFGSPYSIHSDRGTEFENVLIKELCSMLGIIKTKSAPYYPAGNSMVERLFRTAKDMIYATVQSSGKKWTEVLPLIERALRCTKMANTNFTPFEIIFGRKMLPFKNKSEKASTETEYITRIRKHMNEINQQLRKHMRKDGCAEDCKVMPFKVGDRVMAKIYPTQKGIQFPRYDGPYQVVEVLGKWTYRLQHQLTKRIIDRNYYHLKPTRVKESQYKRTTTIETKTMKESIKRNETCEGETGNIEDHRRVRRYPQRHCEPTKRFGFERVNHFV